jgi:hypothetical protein
MIRRLRKAWSITEVAGGAPRRIVLLGTWVCGMVEERLTDSHFRRQELDTAGHDNTLYAGGESHWYAPTPWRRLRQVFPRGSVGPNDVLLDYGSGKGRTAIWVASRFPARHVIGVELDKDLQLAAQKNLECWSGPLRCKNVEFICANATEFEVPDDVTIVYLANPFRGNVFDRVLDNLRASLTRRPRSLKVIYFLPLMHDTVLEAGFYVERQRANHSWVSTRTGHSGAEAVPPWMPPYEWTIYRPTETVA